MIVLEKEIPLQKKSKNGKRFHLRIIREDSNFTLILYAKGSRRRVIKFGMDEAYWLSRALKEMASYNPPLKELVELREEVIEDGKDTER